MRRQVSNANMRLAFLCGEPLGCHRANAVPYLSRPVSGLGEQKPRERQGGVQGRREEGLVTVGAPCSGEALKHAIATLSRGAGDSERASQWDSGIEEEAVNKWSRQE